MPRTKRADAQPKATAKTARKTSVAPQPQSTREQLSSIIKSARDLMRKDAGLSGDLDRLPQLSFEIHTRVSNASTVSRRTTPHRGLP